MTAKTAAERQRKRRDRDKRDVTEILDTLLELKRDLTSLRHEVAKRDVTEPPRSPPNGFPLIPLSLTPPISPPSDQKPSQRRGARLPADFQVPIEWRVEGVALREKAGLPMVNLDAEADHFVDFWHAKAGKDGCKLDWRATWRNWCRNARPANGKLGGTNGRLDDAGLYDGPTEPAPTLEGWKIPMDRTHH